MLWAALGLFAIFLIPGAIVWTRLHLSWSRCLYGDAACSLTFATYLLCVVTLGAFLAAFGAARYAAEALAHEQRAALAVQPCRKKHNRLTHVPDVAMYFTVDSGRELTDTRPGSDVFNRRTWGFVDYMALGVGRAPLIDVVLTASAFMPDGDNPDGAVHVGTLRPDGEAHIRFWFHPSVKKDAQIDWVDAKSAGKILRHFFPERSRPRPVYVKPVDFTQPGPAAAAVGDAPAVTEYDVPHKIRRRRWPWSQP